MARTVNSFAKRLALVVAAVVVVPLALTAGGVAKGPPSAPGEDEEGAANNLSVPAIFVPGTAGSPFVGTCSDGDDSQDPAGLIGVDLDGDGIADDHLGYYVQGVATWQADCATAADNAVTARAEWGDNLTSAPLKAGTPIRVEIGFLADPTAYPMPGYTVVKLDPTLLDRESHYGTLGIEESPFPEARVWNAGVTVDIRSDTTVVANVVPYTAEVNSTGRVVYGFNWQKPVAGTYTITVYAPTIALSTADAGTVSADGHTVTLDVTVGTKGGGGGGGGGGAIRNVSNSRLGRASV